MEVKLTVEIGDSPDNKLFKSGIWSSILDIPNTLEGATLLLNILQLCSTPLPPISTTSLPIDSGKNYDDKG
jgi:hypothetical protein